MELLEALTVLAVVQAAGILILAVLLFRKNPPAKQAWVERERLLSKQIRRLNGELAASRHSERSLRRIVSRQQESSHGQA